MNIVANTQDIKEFLTNGLIITLNGKEKHVKMGSVMYSWTSTLDLDNCVRVQVTSHIVTGFDVSCIKEQFHIGIHFDDGFISVIENDFCNIFSDSESAFEVAKMRIESEYNGYKFNPMEWYKHHNLNGTEEITATWTKEL